MKIPTEANTLRHGFGIDYQVAAEVVAFLPHVFVVRTALGAASEKGGREPGDTAAARAAQHVLDGDELDRRRGHEEVHAWRTASHCHAKVAAVVRRGGGGALVSGEWRASHVARGLRANAERRPAVEGESSYSCAFGVRVPGAEGVSDRGGAIQVEEGWAIGGLRLRKTLTEGTCGLRFLITKRRKK